MSSTEAQTSSAAAKAAVPLPPPPRNGGAALADVVLRFFLFTSCLVAVLVMVTSEQSKLIPIQFPPFLISQDAKFQHSPAFVYFVIALSVAGLYAILTTLISFFALFKRGCYHKIVPCFIVFDVLFLGIMASATGAAGAVGYIGYRGNNHVQWRKVCDVYDVFCRHIGSSIAVSLIGSVVLTFLVILSIRSLSRRD
ncbi:hypothetical protein CASFOL_029690 [Castilleja foliolosa]|uniref:CASP-like protein n=1 Tax=Castilleja foliolosa TaxID=1961234 RepID=A0ABD3CAN5_9LAMI